MSFRIGIILNKDIDEKALDVIRKKYNIGLIRFDNKYVQRQIEENEQFFQFSEHGIDSDYGIGACDICSKDLNRIYNDEELSEKEKSRLIEDIRRRRTSYEKTAEELINIIKDVLSIKGINQIGIFHFNGYSTSDDVKVHKLDKQICNVKDMNIEYIMKIEENTLVYFSNTGISKKITPDINMSWMEVIEEPNGEVFRKLIEYACEINDTLKFKGPSNALYKEYVEEKFEEICKILNRNKEEIMDNYDDEEFMDELYNEADTKLKGKGNLIWSKELEEWIEKMNKEGASKEHIEWLTSDYESECFSHIIMLGLFNRNFNILKQKAKGNLINSVEIHNEYSMSTVRKYFGRRGI